MPFESRASDRAGSLPWHPALLKSAEKGSTALQQPVLLRTGGVRALQPSGARAEPLPAVAKSGGIETGQAG